MLCRWPDCTEPRAPKRAWCKLHAERVRRIWDDQPATEGKKQHLRRLRETGGDQALAEHCTNTLLTRPMPVAGVIRLWNTLCQLDEADRAA